MAVDTIDKLQFLSFILYYNPFDATIGSARDM